MPAASCRLVSRGGFILQLPATSRGRISAAPLACRMSPMGPIGPLSRSEALAQQIGEFAEILQQRGVLSRQQRLRAVGERLLRAGMDLDVNAVGSGSDGGASHGRDQ